jgi:citrate lyase subunit beta / citryl-CoA lyase
MSKTDMPFVAPIFVPADRPDRFDKAASSGADAIIIDLEDAVAPERKEAGRAALRAFRGAATPVCVRINPVGAPDHDLDLEAIAGSDFLCIVPKAESAAEIAEIDRKLGGGRSFIALIESARGLFAAAEIASAPGLRQMAFGPADYALDLSIRPNPDAFGYALATLAVVCRAQGLPGPLDGPCFDLREESLTLETELAAARRLGAAGKLCIHPRQVARVKNAFAPTDEELEEARKILEEGAGVGAASIDGRFLDRPIVERARRMLADGQTPTMPATGARPRA